MTDFIDRVLEPSLRFLADWSLRWAVLVVVLALWLNLIRPRRSATRYLLCLLVFLAGLVLPALPRWGTGFTLPSAKPILARATSAAHNPELPRSGPPVLRTAMQEESRDLAQAILDRESAKESTEQIEAKPAAESWGLRRIAVLSLSVLWSLGAGVQLTHWAGGWLFLQRMRRTAVPVPRLSSEVFQTCRAQLALRRAVTLAAHPAVRSPLTLGLYRSIILVPPSWTELPEQAQRGSLLHELAHLVRYDDWLAVVFEFVRVLFFFHPLLHWLIGRIEYERELLCDEAALAQGIDPRDYAGLLLEFSRQAGRLRPWVVSRSYPLGFGHRRTVKARINRLLEENMKRWMSPLPAGRAAALGTIALGFALVLGSFGVRALEPKSKENPRRERSPSVEQEGNNGLDAGAPTYRSESSTQKKTDPRQTKPAEPKSDPRQSLSYGGHPFDYWRHILMSDLKPEVRIEAIKALSAFGANGYGKEAADAIIQLMRGYEFPSPDRDDRNVTNAAESAFRKIGPEGIPALAEELEHGKLNGRRFAIAALQNMGPTVTLGARGTSSAGMEVHVVPEAAAPAVLKAFKDEDSYVRMRAISSMNTNGVGPKRLIAGLTEALKDAEPNVRRSALSKLEQMGQRAKPAVPALLAALKDDNEAFRYIAVVALLKTGVKLQEALPGIIVGLKDHNHVHKPIFEYLEALGPQAKEAVPALIEAFSAIPAERAEIARVLGNMGPAAKEALPTLIGFMEENKTKHRATNADDAVREALQKISN